MEGWKSPLRSSGIVSAVIGIVALILNEAVGVEITDAQRGQINEMIWAIIEGGALIGALYGRWKAKDRVAMRVPRVPGNAVGLLLLAVVALGVAGCAGGQGNPFATAAQVSDADREARSSIEQRLVTAEREAAALYGTYVIALELGADLAGDASTPDRVVFAVEDAADTAKPFADALYEAIQGYRTAKSAYDRVTGTAESVRDNVTETRDAVVDSARDRLDEAVDRVERVADRARGPIGRLRDAIF